MKVISYKIKGVRQIVQKNRVRPVGINTMSYFYRKNVK